MGSPSDISITYKSSAIPLKVYMPKEYAVLQYMPPKLEIDRNKYVMSPMPGTVVSVLVQKGQKVLAGQTLVILEAMKMQNMIKAERDGYVAEVLVNEN